MGPPGAGLLIDPDALLERIAWTEAMLQWVTSNLLGSLAVVGAVIGYQVVMLWWEHRRP